MPKDTLLTAREVAAYLRCSLSTVRRLVAGGRIPHFRLGKLVRFRRGDVDAWLRLYHEGELPADPARAPAPHPDQLLLFQPPSGRTRKRK
ncbi:MAG: helix-turn-helix domain-containing protein [Gemmatimonadota bacterium]